MLDKRISGAGLECGNNTLSIALTLTSGCRSLDRSLDHCSAWSNATYQDPRSFFVEHQQCFHLPTKVVCFIGFNVRRAQLSKQLLFAIAQRLGQLQERRVARPLAQTLGWRVARLIFRSAEQSSTSSTACRGYSL